MKLSKQQMDALNNCLKCSICVDSCPVTKVNPQFPGPKQLAVDWLRIAQETAEQPNDAVAYCSNCKTCETVCPSGVHIATLNQLVKYSLPPKGLGLREKILSDPAKLGKLMSIWPQAGNLALSLPLSKVITEKTIGISAQAPMPAYSTQTLCKRLSENQIKQPPASQEVLYFPGCYARYNQPQVGMALIRILSKLNYKVIIPNFRCCGQPAISNAHLKDTRKMAEVNLDILKQHHKKGMPILFSCPSCMLTVKEEYAQVLGMEEFAPFSSAIMDAGRFLLEHENQIRNLISEKHKQHLSLGYHEPCHLKASGQGTPGYSLLKRTAGLDLIPLEAGCCGLAGSYGFKKEKHWIAEEIGKNVLQAIEASGVQAVVTECGMCTSQISHLSQLPVYHPLLLLADMIEA